MRILTILLRIYCTCELTTGAKVKMPLKIAAGYVAVSHTRHLGDSLRNHGNMLFSLIWKCGCFLNVCTSMSITIINLHPSCVSEMKDLVFFILNKHSSSDSFAGSHTGQLCCVMIKCPLHLCSFGF